LAIEVQERPTGQEPRRREEEEGGGGVVD